jgi:hypothetical protein
VKKKEPEIEAKVVKKVYFKTFTLTILQAGASQIFQIGPARKEEPKS